jgi:hypothetical protein
VVAALAAVVLVVSLVPSGAGAAPGGESGRWSGRAAVNHLGDRLPAVAARYGKPPAELRRHLLEDPTLFVDGTDSLFYVEPTAPTATSTVTTFDSTIADADTFRLHSRPGANRVIYLDFDGQILSGTAWNTSTGGTCYAEPYDTDSSPSTFDATELAVVKSVWRRVAEDYALFDVDVTTEDPGTDAITRSGSGDVLYGTRALVTRSVASCPNGKTLYQSVCPNGCGGIAYVGVFGLTSSHSYYQPALVFQNGVSGAKNIAEAASHEVGHNIGLSHDGTTSGCGTLGTSPCGYYSGHGSWAPIMGIGYNRAITQWSRGEYAGANNTENDYAVAGANGLPVIPDDHGGTSATASALSGPSPAAEGVISTPSDIDAFTVTVGAGPLSLTASPVPTSPNLDIRLELRAADGTLVAAANPASGSSGSDTSTGMAATVSATVPAGVYTLLVDGVGAGDPATNGYSDWGSLGRYRLSGTVTDAAADPTVRVDVAQLTVSGSRVSRSNVTGTATVTVRAADGSPAGSVTVSGSWFLGTKRLSNKTATTDSAGVATSSSGSIKASAGQQLRFCVTNLTRTNSVWDKTLFAPTDASDCATWVAT